jgi:hypothetical protein
LRHFCRILAFHPIPASQEDSTEGPASEDSFRPEAAMLLVLENPTTMGTALEAIRTLLDDASLRQRLLGCIHACLALAGDPAKDQAKKKPGKSAEVAEFVGPREGQTDFWDSVPEVHALLEKMGFMAKDDEDDKEDKPKAQDVPPPPGLPRQPFNGRYKCGKCGVDVRVGGLSPGHCSLLACSGCQSLLYYLAESVDRGPLYPSQYMVQLPWKGSAQCRHPARSKERLLEVWRDVAVAMSYVLDEIQHGGRSEVWQSGSESLRSKKGDCEDHSILLADWLISEGYEARVAIGDAQGGGFSGGDGGHAWVVVRLDGVEYHLEATAKNDEPMAPVDQVESVWPGRRYVARHPFDHHDFWTLEPQLASKSGSWFSRWVSGLFGGGANPPSFWNESVWQKGMYLRDADAVVHDPVVITPPQES